MKNKFLHEYKTKNILTILHRLHEMKIYNKKLNNKIKSMGFLHESPIQWQKLLETEKNFIEEEFKNNIGFYYLHTAKYGQILFRLNKIKGKSKEK